MLPLVLRLIGYPKIDWGALTSDAASGKTMFKPRHSCSQSSPLALRLFIPTGSSPLETDLDAGSVHSPSFWLSMEPGQALFCKLFKRTTNLGGPADKETEDTTQDDVPWPQLNSLALVKCGFKMLQACFKLPWVPYDSIHLSNKIQS